MMAKKLLEGYTIGDGGGDLIDQLSPEAGGSGASPEPPPAGEPTARSEGSGEFSPNGGRSGDRPAAGETIVPFPGTPGAAAAEKEYPLRCRKDGLFDLFSIGGLEYRLGGVKPLFVTSLRVNIRAGNGKASYYDSLDLYAARNRSSFAQAVQRHLGEEPARVERDLVRVLEHLEKERDAALLRNGREEKKELTAAEKELALELLRDPRLFDRIAEDLSALGYVGETLNKQLLYLCASSRKLEDPISVLILSQSASGKSFLVDTVRRLMPEEDVVAVTSLSDQALNYIEDLRHKFLILGEAVHGEIIEHQIREMLSGKELSRLVTVKDADTGKLQSRIVRTPVIVSSVMGSTNYRVNPENASRCFVVNADESREQTGRIHESQRRKYSLEKLRHGEERARGIVKQHQAAQRLLRKRHIVNDYAPYLDFPTALMRLRRDHDRFLDLIACVCFLRQFQKREEHEGDLTFIRCDAEDYRTAYRIMVEGVLASTVRELPAGAQGLYEDIRGWVRKEAKKQGLGAAEISFTQRQIREATGLSHTWVQMNLRHLVSYEYLELVRGGAARTCGYYRLRADEDILTLDLSMIPTPEAMEAKLGRRR
jgi:energy-coupling factor transporter ATP-binding protein EcfA2